MKGRAGAMGAKVRVDVGPYNPALDALRREAVAILKGKQVSDVYLAGEQLIIVAEDGGELTVNAPGGFRRVD